MQESLGTPLHDGLFHQPMSSFSNAYGSDYRFRPVHLNEDEAHESTDEAPVAAEVTAPVAADAEGTDDPQDTGDADRKPDQDVAHGEPRADAAAGQAHDFVHVVYTMMPTSIPVSSNVLYTAMIVVGLFCLVLSL